HEISCEFFKLGELSFTKVDEGEVEGDERRVVGHTTLQEGALDLKEGRLSFRGPAETQGYVGLGPVKAKMINRLSTLKEELNLGKELSRLLITASDRKAAEQIETGAGKEAWILDLG